MVPSVARDDVDVIALEGYIPEAPLKDVFCAFFQI
jgi:hypothetical protein